MVKNPPANAGDTRDAGLIPWLGRSPGGGNGKTLQYSCLGNPWTEELGGLQTMVSQKSDMTENIIKQYFGLYFKTLVARWRNQLWGAE